MKHIRQSRLPSRDQQVQKYNASKRTVRLKNIFAVGASYAVIASLVGLLCYKAGRSAMYTSQAQAHRDRLDAAFNDSAWLDQYHQYLLQHND